MVWRTIEFPVGFADNDTCQHDGCSLLAASRFVSVSHLGTRRSTARCTLHAVELRTKLDEPVPVPVVPAPVDPDRLVLGPDKLARRSHRFPIPEQHLVAACGSCRAPIVWINTERGKLMPVEAAGEYRGESHFAHCPNADAHRKPR